MRDHGIRHRKTRDIRSVDRQDVLFDKTCGDAVRGVDRVQALGFLHPHDFRSSIYHRTHSDSFGIPGRAFSGSRCIFEIKRGIKNMIITIRRIGIFLIIIFFVAAGVWTYAEAQTDRKAAPRQSGAAQNEPPSEVDSIPLYPPPEELPAIEPIPKPAPLPAVEPIKKPYKPITKPKGKKWEGTLIFGESSVHIEPTSTDETKITHEISTSFTINVVLKLEDDYWSPSRADAPGHVLYSIQSGTMTYDYLSSLEYDSTTHPMMVAPGGTPGRTRSISKVHGSGSVNLEPNSVRLVIFTDGRYELFISQQYPVTIEAWKTDQVKDRQALNPILQYRYPDQKEKLEINCKGMMAKDTSRIHEEIKHQRNGQKDHDDGVMWVLGSATMCDGMTVGADFTLGAAR